MLFSMVRIVPDPRHWMTREKKNPPFLDIIWCKQLHLKATPFPTLVETDLEFTHVDQRNNSIYHLHDYFACLSDEFEASSTVFCISAGQSNLTTWLIHIKPPRSRHGCLTVTTMKTNFPILFWVSHNSELQNTLRKILLLQTSVALSYQITCASPHPDRDMAVTIRINKRTWRRFSQRRRPELSVCLNYPPVWKETE